MDRFLRSIFIPPPVVAGRQLRPLSCYHWAALSLLQSPFPYYRGKDLDPRDFVTAVYICQNGIEDGPRTLFPTVNLDEAAKIRDAFDLVRDMTAFLTYVDDVFDFLPEVSHPAGSGRIETPAPFFFPAMLLRHYHGITRVQAWDMFIPEAVAFHVARMEYEEGRKVVTDTDREVKASILADAAASGIPYPDEVPRG